MASFENKLGKRFEELVVDGDGCSKFEVLAVMQAKPSSFALLHSEWKSIALHIGIVEHKIKQLSDDYIMGVRIKSLPQLIDELLSNWKGDKGNQARISHLCNALRANRLNDIAQSLEERFSMETQNLSDEVEIPRQFKDKIIGEDDCTKAEVAAVIERSIKFRKLRTEWRSVARCLGIENYKIDQLSLDYISGVKVKTLEELLNQLLSLCNKNNQAKISKFCKALEKNGLDDISQALVSNLLKQDVVQAVDFEWQGKVVKLENLIGETTSEEIYQKIRLELRKQYYSKPIRLIKDELVPTKPNFYVPKTFAFYDRAEIDPDRQVTIGEDDMVRRILCLPTLFGISISDSSGMGKTLVLASVTIKIGRENPDSIALFIVLQDFVQKLNFVNSASSALEAIADYAACCDISKLILAEFKNGTEKLFLFLDGYDKITNNKLDQVDSFLRYLLKSANIIVTTRPHLNSRLEAIFNQTSYGVVPFDEQRQINFLTKYWIDQYEATEGKHLEEFGKQCLRELGIKMTDKEKEIAGIPLQCMMLAEVHAEDAKQISNLETMPDIDDFMPISSLFQMYKRLVDLKFSRIQDKSVRQNYIHAHVHESIALLFPDLVDIFKPILSGCDEIDRNSFYSIGLTEKSSNMERPKFIHRTFAEYVLAECIVENLNNGWEFLDLLFGEILGQAGTFRSKDDNGNYFYVLKNPALVYFIEMHLKESKELHGNDELSQKTNGNFFRHSLTIEDLCMTMVTCCGKQEYIFDYAWKLLNYFHTKPNREERKLQRAPLMNIIKTCRVVEDQILEFFREEDTNFNAEDSQGDSVLFYALAYSKTISCIKKLLRYGANVNHTNKKLQNSAHKLIERKLPSHQILDWLKLLESKYEFVLFDGNDIQGRTPLDYARTMRKKDDRELISFLENRIASEK